METKIIIAGFGGQGVLFGGTLIAQAALEEGKQTTWFPAYGAEIRGGTANSTAIVSDEEIGSPIITNPDILIILNEQSLDKFLPRMKPGTLVVINSSLVKNKVEKEGVRIVEVPASGIADKQIGDIRTANLVAIGAMLKAKPVLKLESALKACEKVLTEKPKLITINQKALQLGYDNK
ncbi:MAG: 2-oxoacid:acceptor oxidoreductase family protein [Elusimicrobiota bacterium]